MSWRVNVFFHTQHARGGRQKNRNRIKKAIPLAQWLSYRKSKMQNDPSGTAIKTRMILNDTKNFIKF